MAVQNFPSSAPAKPGAKVTWHGDSFLKNLERNILVRLRRAGVFLERDIKRSLSTSSRPIPDNRSKPGGTPHADTGGLRKSIFWDINKRKLLVIVGTPLKYGLWLEIGTKRSVVIRAKPGKFLIIPVGKSARTFKGKGAKKRRKASGVKRIKWRGKTLWVIFRKVVRRGPMKARPYLRPALQRNRRKLKEILVAPMSFKTGKGRKL